MNLILQKIKGFIQKAGSAFTSEKFSAHKKIFLLIGLVVLIGVAGMPHPARAESIPQMIGAAVMNFFYTGIGKVVYALVSFTAVIGGAIVAILAWIISIVLNLNDQLLNTDAVQVGFSVSLSVANLGFVFGIIVIAIATILRSQSYGLKQILWKLVAAAILVNFSLVIVAPIYNFANQLTWYFLNCTTGSCNNAGSFVAMKNFAAALAGAFNPQQGFMLALNTTTSTNPVLADPTYRGAFSVVGESIGKLLVPIMSGFFVSAILIVIDITLISFIVMLFVRYITLGILFIIMPFAWLMWIFPNLSHLWSKWWNTFWRWTLFAPIVVFFLYLAILTSRTMSSQPAMNVATYQSTGDPNSPFTMLANLLGTAFTPILGSIMQQLIIVGLAVGGIFAANSMSIHGAGAAMGAVKAVKNATVGFVGRQAKKGGRAAWRGVGGQKITASLQGGKGISDASQKLGGVLRKIPLVGGVAGKAVEATGRGIEKIPGAQRLQSIAGRQLAESQHNKDLVDEAKKHTPDDKHELLENLKGSMRTELQMAHIQKGVDKGWIGPDTKIGTAGERFADWKNKHENDFENYGQGKLSDDADTAMGSNKEMRDIIKTKEQEIATDPVMPKVNAEINELEEKIKAAKAKGDPTNELELNLKDAKAYRDRTVKPINDKYQPTIDAAQDKFLGDRTKDDMRKMNVNAIFGPEASKTMADAIQRGLAKSAPQLVAGFLSKMKSPALKEFGDSYPKQIERLIDETERRNDIADDEKRKLINGFRKTLENFEKSLSFNMYGVSNVEEGGGGGPAPAAEGGHA